MALLTIETRRQELLSNLESAYSDNLRAYLIAQFFDELFTENNSLLKESYCSEFIDIFYASLDGYNAHCIHPEITERIINTIRKAEK